MRTAPLSDGVGIQVYRDAIHAPSRAAKLALLDAQMARWQRLGVVRYHPHCFPSEFATDTSALTPHIELAAKHGMACMPAFGLNSDGPAAKGERMGRVARLPGVHGIALDAEGKFEDESAAAEAQHVRDMNATLLAALPPTMPVLNQAWMDPSGHWSRYPWVPLAEATTHWAPQWYINDWTKYLGKARYDTLMPKWAAQWDRLIAQKLAPAGYGDLPIFGTWQGYAWDDIPNTCVAAMLRYPACMVWCEPFPTETVLRAIRVRTQLDLAVGLRVTGAWCGANAIARFQAAYNATAPAVPLVEDNRFGPRTEAALNERVPLVA